ncbi:hypothetical protein ACFVVM_32380 [Nocardia sp. NPDC058176]|uniref:hypothetical protein n=1 Tax=Nocardia sp. NPDC058176 TaxID=3346368 RepID=UPI0036DEAE63
MCDGTGWQDAVPGYSCWRDPDQLIAYMRERVGVLDDADGVVIEFDGEIVDSGFDGEPTAIPHEVIQTMVWSRFIADRRASTP